jgi:hypothetical protein
VGLKEFNHKGSHHLGIINMFSSCKILPKFIFGPFCEFLIFGLFVLFYASMLVLIF